MDATDCKTLISFKTISTKEEINYMKKLLYLLSLIPALSLAQPVYENPITEYGTPVTVSIDNSTLTKVPTSQTLSGRTGIFLGVPNTNTGVITGFIGNCTSTALANTIRPLDFAASSNSSYIPLRDDQCLWLITTHSGAESVHYQEVTNK